MSCLYPWRSLFDAARREPSGSGVSEVHRPPGNRGELSLGRIGTIATGPRLRPARRHRRSQGAYQDFLTLWKDADLDLPVLVAAKADYAKLQ